MSILWGKRENLRPLLLIFHEERGRISDSYHYYSVEISSTSLSFLRKKGRKKRVPSFTIIHITKPVEYELGFQ